MKEKIINYIETLEAKSLQVDDYFKQRNELYIENQKKDKEIERLNNLINEALGIANERFNYYSNHKNNNEEHLEDWENIFNILLRRDNK